MDDDFDFDFDDSTSDDSDSFELPELSDILGDFDLPEIGDILDYGEDANADVRDLEFSDSDIADDFQNAADDFASEAADIAQDLSEVEDLVQQALDDNMHPSELERNIDGLAPDDIIEQIVDAYTDDLTEKLGLESRDDDAGTRGTFETYDDVLNYLESFHGGFPGDDIFYIELTDEGYELYVYEDTPWYSSTPDCAWC